MSSGYDAVVTDTVEEPTVSSFMVKCGGKMNHMLFLHAELRT